MLKELDDYDWKEAFSYASGFSIEDVEEVLAHCDGENEGASWLSFGRLKDGRFYFLAAGCDYTGWDCQASGDSFAGTTRDEVERFGMGDGERSRLGIVLPEGVEHRERDLE